MLVKGATDGQLLMAIISELSNTLIMGECVPANDFWSEH